MGEFEIIERYFTRQKTRRRDTRIGVGDDAAVLRPASDRDLVVTTDVLINGVHFPVDTPPAAIGHKALAVNLSDIAAMGAEPAWATLALTLEDLGEAWLASFCEGFLGLADEFGVELVGGDTTRGPLAIAVQLIGMAGDSGVVTRGGARDQDLIYVSGTLGDAALGLSATSGNLDVDAQDRAGFVRRLQWPVPRVALGRALAPYASAAIDISDGLVADLGHICAASGVGATVDVSRLPLSDAYRRAWGRVGRAPALSFGDDYELCVTVPPVHAAVVEDIAAGLGPGVTCIGRIAGSCIEWHQDGTPLEIHESGYRHFR